MSTVRVDLDADACDRLAGWSATHSLDDEAREFRSALGLPVDRPIVMTGHQSEWWHPGILAKLMAARSIADRSGAAVVWLVVDQDDNDPGELAVPITRDGGVVATETVHLAPPVRAATGWRPPIVMGDVSPSIAFASRSAREGFDRITHSMRNHAGERSAARQVWAAMADELRHVGGPDHVVFASDMARTAAWARFVNRMSAELDACVREYNGPAKALADAHVRPLEFEASTNRWELPMWSIGKDGTRNRVWSGDARLSNPATVIPRALSMTAVVRMHGCELFLHGTGGAAYDRLTERWIEGWLHRTLAPAGLATADVRLEFDGGTVDAKALANAAWRAHRAKHDPGVLGDAASARARDEALGLMRRAGDDPSARNDAYRALHRALEAYRTAHREELVRLDAEVDRMRGAFRASRDTVMARAWPFPYYPAEALGDLRGRIDDAVGAGCARREAASRSA